MDITSIINSDDAPQSRKPSIPISAKQEHRSSLNGFPDAQAPVYDNRRNIRPPQPAPLQTPAYSGPHYATASPHDNLRSPYHGTSSFSSSSGQYPPPQAPHQSPRYSHQNLQYPQRENSATSGPHSGRSFGQSTPLNQTPNTSTPGSANIHSGFPRPSSSHSIPTPNSSRNPSSFLKESPQPLPPQSRTFSQPYGAPQYVSQPGTPLGPPSTHGRSSINSHQTSPGEYHHQRTYSGGYHGHQEPAGPPAVTNMSPSAYREHHPGIQANLKQHERQESLSVSPKTRLPSLPSINRMSPIREPSRSDLESTEFVAPIKREHESNGSTRYSESQPTRRPSHPVGMMSLLNEEPSQESPERIYQPSQVQNHPHIKHNGDSSLVDHSTLDQRFTNHSSSPSDQDSRQSQILPAQQSPLAHQSHHSPPRHDSNQSITQTSVNAGGVSSFKMAALKTSNSLLESKLPSEKKTSRGSKNAKRSIQDASEIEASEDSILAESQPVRKKPRTEGALKKPLPVPPQQDQYQVQVKTKKVPRITHWQDVPIFARSIRGPDRTMKLFQQNLTGSIPRSHVSQTNGNTKLHAQVPQQPPPANGIMSSVTPLPPSGDGPLGPWEVSFTDTIPADEVTRIIADYLFLNVVRNNDVGVAPAGGGRGLGAVLEIEAKIGRLIDKTTNDRLRLPVLNECVVDLADPNMRLKFESSMTEYQHRNLNQYLNKALVDSQGPKQGAPAPRKARIPMTYKHTKEIDTFYEINQQAALKLPHTVTNGPAHKAKVRITTDEKTGEELAKIIKTRVADIHIYSPRSLFDWRISVSVEMDFEADVKDLVAVEKRDGKADRRKDRVSYRHLRYQIDLTQVTPAEPANKFNKEHELEIEVSSEEVRRQGLLVMNGHPNGYEDLIKGFVDNVRLLARYCKE